MSLQEVTYRGSLISTGAPQVLSLPCTCDQFVLRNRTRLAAGAGVVEARYVIGMPDLAGEIVTLGGGILVTTYVVAATPADAFTYVDPTTATLGAATVLNGGFIPTATPAVPQTATPAPVGSVVRIYGTTGMLQIAGMDFTVTANVAATSMTFGYLAAAGFGAAATAGTFRIVPYDKWYPRWRYITGITAAAQAVVSFSVTHGYVVGEKLSFRVPASFGMIQMNGLTGTVTAINPATNAVTVDINSTAFTAFAFPTSAVAAAGTSFPIAVPAGESATILTAATRDVGVPTMRIGATIQGTALDVFDYWVYRSAS